MSVQGGIAAAQRGSQHLLLVPRARQRLQRPGWHGSAEFGEQKPGVLLPLIPITTHSRNAFTPSLGKVMNTDKRAPFLPVLSALCFQLGFGI